MNARKFVALLLAVFMVMMIAGCGGTAEQSSAAALSSSDASSGTSALQAASAVEGGIKKPADFPKREITWIVPFAAGGAFDTMARTLQPILKEMYDVDIVVKNVPGGGSAVGVTECMVAKPNGYTVAMGSTSYLGLIAQGLMDAEVGDATYLCQLSEDPMVLITKVGGKYDTAQAFIDAAKANPGTVTLGNPGTNNTNQALSQFLDEALDGAIEVIPYSDGAARAVTEVIGGHCDAATIKPNDCKSQLASGEVQAIAVFGKERLEVFPDVPTFEELGIDIFPYGDVARTVVFAIAPAGIDPEIQEYLTEIIYNATQSEKFQQLAKEGAFSSPGIKGDALEVLVDELYSGAEILAEKVFVN